MKTLFTILITSILCACSQIPPNGFDCLTDSQSARCSISEAESFLDSISQSPPTTDELIGLVILTTGIGIVTQHHFGVRPTLRW